MRKMLTSPEFLAALLSGILAGIFLSIGAVVVDFVDKWRQEQPVTAQLSWVNVPNPFSGHPERASAFADLLKNQFGFTVPANLSLSSQEAKLSAIGSVYITNPGKEPTKKEIVVTGNAEASFLASDVGSAPVKSITVPILPSKGEARISFISSETPAFRVFYGSDEIKLVGWDNPLQSSIWVVLAKAFAIIVAVLSGAILGRLAPKLWSRWAERRQVTETV